MKKIPYSFSKRGDIINQPHVNEIVWYCDGDKVDMKAVIINSGQFYSNGRISNFWYWQEVFEDGSLGYEEHGYGHFYEYKGSYKVKRVIEFV